MLIYQIIKSELSNIFQKTINLIYQINKFVESEHQFMINIMKKTFECIKFVIERYIQKSDKFNKSVSHQQHIESRFQTSSLQFFSNWTINRASLQVAIYKFDFSTKNLHLDSFNMTDRSSVSVNLTKLNIQQMIDITVQQAITAALQAQKIMTSQSFKS